MTDPGRVRRALVIEDEQDILDLLAGHLRHCGFTVTAADTGERGLAIAQADPPEVVLVDVMLPGMNGREVVRQLKQDPRTRGCAVIVCTVLDPADVGETAADALLRKPFRRATLVHTVQMVTTGGER